MELHFSQCHYNGWNQQERKLYALQMLTGLFCRDQMLKYLSLGPMHCLCRTTLRNFLGMTPAYTQKPPHWVCYKTKFTKYLKQSHRHMPGKYTVLNKHSSSKHHWAQVCPDCTGQKVLWLGKTLWCKDWAKAQHQLSTDFSGYLIKLYAKWSGKKKKERRKKQRGRSRKKEKNPEQLSHSYWSGYISIACW